jgi:HAD superfamily hydrolase (TIGR01509 family)
VADLSGITTVSLDAGGVLVVPNWQRVSDLLAREGISVPVSELRRVEPAARFALDEPRRVASSNDAQRGGEYFNRIFDDTGVPHGPARERALAAIYEYHSAHNLWEDVPQGVASTLTQLSERGFRLVVASNANGLIERVLERQGLLPQFAAVCDSCIEGVEKPDTRFFSIVVQRAGGTPETTLHVGDLFYVDIVGARKAGLHAVLLDPSDLYSAIETERIHRLEDLLGMLPPKAPRRT